MSFNFKLYFAEHAINYIVRCALSNETSEEEVHNCMIKLQRKQTRIGIDSNKDVKPISDKDSYRKKTG